MQTVSGHTLQPSCSLHMRYLDKDLGWIEKSQNRIVCSPCLSCSLLIVLFQVTEGGESCQLVESKEA